MINKSVHIYAGLEPLFDYFCFHSRGMSSVIFEASMFFPFTALRMKSALEAEFVLHSYVQHLPCTRAHNASLQMD